MASEDLIIIRDCPFALDAGEAKRKENQTFRKAGNKIELTDQSGGERAVSIDLGTRRLDRRAQEARRGLNPAYAEELRPDHYKINENRLMPM